MVVWQLDEIKLHIIQLINQKVSIKLEAMRQYDSLKRKAHRNYSKSLANLHQYDIAPLQLKDLWLRKSFFNPSINIAQTYAARSHIAGADVPTIQVVYSDSRWLLLQAPKYSQKFFDKVNSGRISNPFQVLLKIFKSFLALAKRYGYFIVTQKMIFCRKKQTCAWISEDIFSNSPQATIQNSKTCKKEFVGYFVKMLQNEMKQFEGIGNIDTSQDVVKMLDWYSKLNRESLTAVHASKAAMHPNESKTSFEPHELKYYSDKLKGCMSLQNIKKGADYFFRQSDLSNSLTIKESEKKLLEKKVDRAILYDCKDMKYSIYDQTKPINDQPHEVRRTKKKFNLTSTSSTLQKFSDKMKSTIGRRPLRLKKSDKHKEDERDRRDTPNKRSLKEQDIKNMHKSEPLSIANELDGLFQDDQKHAFKLGVEGDREELEKIAQEIEQILIW